ncbi:epidermal growth factor-like protein 8 [Littorina saxatilis]|uniref:epidermal growth factor-like protein 8 n=1 Tax=Littorina saxatilis TaxID=31220 RepID=UPI0038B6A0B3
MKGDEKRLYLCGHNVAWEYVSLLLGLLLALADAEVFHSGRHVCVQQRQRAQPVPYRQSYRRAIYRQSMQMCEGFRVCSRLSLAYQTAYRTVFHMQIRTHFVQGCCPGWQQAEPHDTGCSQPVCSSECENGGKCVAPDTCECPDGWTGPDCQKDIDECEGGNKCQQVCQNLPGSYECSCQDGFKIAKDEVSCSICLSCLPEFKDMQTTISTLNNRVEELETEKELLMGNLTSMVTHYDEVMDQMQAAQAAAVTSSPVTSQEDEEDYGDINLAGNVMPGFDRLASLSNQISLLEERMADCTCENYGRNPR